MSFPPSIDDIESIVRRWIRPSFVMEHRRVMPASHLLIIMWPVDSLWCAYRKFYNGEGIVQFWEDIPKHIWRMTLNIHHRQVEILQPMNVQRSPGKPSPGKHHQARGSRSHLHAHLGCYEDDHEGRAILLCAQRGRCLDMTSMGWEGRIQHWAPTLCRKSSASRKTAVWEY